MTDDPRTALPHGHFGHSYWRERAELAEARAAELEAKNERHRRANLVRAVTAGYDPDADEWIREAINAEDWDAVPWRIAENLGAEVRRLRDAAQEVSWAQANYNPTQDADAAMRREAEAFRVLRAALAEETPDGPT